ncbi:MULTISPECIES: hypothetical protein [Comamonas]|uniref:Uncharacterized protein n=1 Tax=Comamonas squillarum TaxID=2977320 RepID=A0ABY6A0P4_9BURK|nr:hypothetical protein [Comamonas sp. PR12]UXC19842.1 hypothetical protein N4T19_06995 [Comamonas sp. PR12]
MLFTLRHAKPQRGAVKTHARPCFFASIYFSPRYKCQKPDVAMGYWLFYPGFYTVFWPFDVKFVRAQMTA